MEVKHLVFEKLLIDNGIKKTDFSKYSKISYFTVTGWKKRDIVPAYAIVILKDMIYRKKLEAEAEQNLRRSHTVPRIKHSLTANEENILKSAFWGTNYTIDDIAEEIRHNNQDIIKKVEENLSADTATQIIGKLSHA